MKNTENKFLKPEYIAWIILIILIVFIVFLFINILPIFNKDRNNNFLAPVLLLIGTLITTAVTLVGILLKRSFDIRTSQLESEAQERLKLETALKAIELIGQDESNTSKSRVAGSLFALISLGQVDFVLSLLGPLWGEKRIDSLSAVSLLSKVFDGPKEFHRMAAEIYSNNIVDVTKDDSLTIPDQFWTGDLDSISSEALEIMINSILRLLVSIHLNSGVVTVSIVILYQVIINDKSDNPAAESINSVSLKALDILLNSKKSKLNYLKGDGFRNHKGEIFYTEPMKADVKIKLEKYKGTPIGIISGQLLGQLKEHFT